MSHRWIHARRALSAFVFATVLAACSGGSGSTDAADASGGPGASVDAGTSGVDARAASVHDEVSAARVTTSEPPTAPPVPYRRKVPMRAPVAVPAAFVGLHTHRWPGASATPSYGYGTARSHNYFGDDSSLGLLWYAINTADGVYDWTRMDRWVETNHAAGKRLIYTVYGTPAWCASDTRVKDPYHQPGGDSRPRDLGCVSRFVDALVRRYNAGPTRRIQLIEIWNEPNFEGYVYWRDSASDLAALGRSVYRAAKAADPGIKVLWPAFVEWYTAPVVWKDNLAYGNAPDGAGGVGKDWADGFAFHFYGYNTGMDDLMDNQESALKTLAALGKPQWQTWNTEIGMGDGWGRTQSAEVQAQLIRRWLALSAAYGNQVAALYAHDSENLGYPDRNPVTAAAIDEAHRRLAGKTIREAGVLQDGRVWIVFGDNSTWAI
ncbi:MAG: hypothetical protein AB7P21_28530 [Lautropia sp.]